MDALNRLMRDEGFMTHAYRCPAGKTTIGYGRNIDRDGGKGVTRAEATTMLMNDIRECEADLRDVVFGPMMWDSFGGVRQNAFINMRFNLGPTGFRSFKKMVASARRRAWPMVAHHAEDSAWRWQVKGRAERIIEELRSGVDLEDG